MNHAEPIVAVMHLGVVNQQISGGLFGLIEMAGMNQVDHDVGRCSQGLRLLQCGLDLQQFFLVVLLQGNFVGLLIGNLRLVLDAVLTSGKQHTSGHAKAPLKRLLDELGEHKPALVRGDCGYGNQDIIDICEERGLPYLLRLR
ncbi:MAG TPA: transposase, partial [Burkholderiaceae bacterium]|nr:transposase [Burkholderiaceae bacterium]